MDHAYARLREFCDDLSRVLGYLVALAVLVMFIAIFSQVVCRYIFHSPLNWAEELTQFLMAWMSFLGAAAAVWTWSHVGIDIVLNAFRGRARDVLFLLIRGAVLLFALFLFAEGLDFVIGSRGMVSDGMRVPMVWPRLAVPVGGACMTLFTLTHLLGDLRALRAVKADTHD